MQYLVPNCASSSPSSGDAVLMGVLLKQQDDANLPLLRYIARGSRSFFPILIGNIDKCFIVGTENFELKRTFMFFLLSGSYIMSFCHRIPHTV